MNESKRIVSKKRIILLARVVLLLFILSGGFQSAHATCTKFVSPTGSDSNNGTSYTSPWQTVEHAFENVTAGDTVCFEGGVYSTGTSYVTSNCGVGTSDAGHDDYAQVLAISGSSGSPITFTNYPGQIAIIEGDTRIGSAGCPVSYVTFQGTPTLNTGAYGLVFEQCPGLYTTTANHPCPLQTTPESVVDLLNFHHVTFDNVEIRYGNYHAGIYEEQGDNIQLLNSYIHDNGCPSSDAECPSGSINTDQGIYFHDTTGGGNLIANCVIENNVSAGIQLYPSPANVIVEENTITNNGVYGIILYGSSNTIANNIVANNGVVGDTQMKVDDSNPTNFVIDRNVLWCWDTSKCAQGIWYVNCTAPCTQIDTNTTTADPKFIDAAAGYVTPPLATTSHHNYRLQSTSPAFTTQNSSYVQTADKDGVSRSGISALGAYVY